MDNYIAVDEKRYDQLIRAEHDAIMLKAVIAEHHENNKSLFSSDLEMLYKLFIGNKEEE